MSPVLAKPIFFAPRSGGGSSRHPAGANCGARAVARRLRADCSRSWYGGIFILGMVVVHAVLGLISSFGSNWVRSLRGRYWGLLFGPGHIVPGPMWPGWIKVPLPAWKTRIIYAECSVDGAERANEIAPHNQRLAISPRTFG